MEESQNDYTSDSLDAKAMMVKKLEVFVTRTLVRNCNKPNPQRVKHNQLETVCENFKFYIFTTTDSPTSQTDIFHASRLFHPSPPPHKKKKYHHAENALFIVKNKKSEEHQCEASEGGTTMAQGEWQSSTTEPASEQTNQDSTAEEEHWKEEILMYFTAQRATPHPARGHNPVQLHF